MATYNEQLQQLHAKAAAAAKAGTGASSLSSDPLVAFQAKQGGITAPKTPTNPAATEVAKPTAPKAVKKPASTVTTPPASTAPAAPAPAAPPAPTPTPDGGSGPSSQAEIQQAAAAKPDYNAQVKAAQDAYLKSLQPSADVTAAQTQLGDISTQAGQQTAAAQKEYADRIKAVEAQATLQPFLTGRQTQAAGQLSNELAAIRAGSEAQTIPLQQRLAQFQAAQQAEQQQAQAGLEFAKPPAPVSVAAGATAINPLTGEAIFTSPFKPSTTPSAIQEYAYAQGQGYKGSFTDYQRDIAAQKAAVSPAATPTSYDEWTLAGKPGSYEQFLATKGGTAGTASPQAVKFQQDTNNRILTTVDDALGKINNYTTGAGAAVLGGIPGTDAFNFARTLDTLKANIAFGTLQDMRNASKSGGALGQISDKEEVLLSSVLGSLDARQSPAQLKANLQQIKDSIVRWNEALASQGTQEQSGATADASFKW